MPTPSRRLLTAALAALALVLAGCGDGDGDASSVDESAGASGTPRAIVSLSPTATEMLYAVGAGDQVVAVDDQSNYPDGVPTTALSGYNPNVEAILGHDPDLVVASDDTGGLVAGLDKAGVKTLILPSANTLDDTYSQIEKVGVATGHVGDATELVSRMQTEIGEIIASVPKRDVPLRYYHELDNTYYSVTDDTFIGDVYSRLGLTSIATGANAYPQLSAEFVVEQNPDVVFLADGKCCGTTPETVAQRAGWADLTAVRDGHVVVLDDDIASRWGPRVVDLMRAVAAAVATVPAAQPAS